MKGWIKVHEASERELYLRAEDIYSVEDYLEDEKEDFETHKYTLINDRHYVSETVDEVLALIEKAEGLKEEKEDWKQELRQFILKHYQERPHWSVDRASYYQALKDLSKDFGLYDNEREAFLDSSVDELEFCVRTSNALANGRSDYNKDTGEWEWRIKPVGTIRDLTSRTAKELLGLRNFSKKSLSEVREKLAKEGLSLKDDKWRADTIADTEEEEQE